MREEGDPEADPEHAGIRVPQGSLQNIRLLSESPEEGAEGVPEST